ncbi:hypothetical protein Tsubulata_015295 [Turnera subulata]|uniref:Transcription repressor n=1 Tax=Turnera subulata TaxID=218843 RepID=A0A9Q0FTT8_9ROSI|nr:hypothetical protein Tsubulata_015295 [Turnera subulata]
MKLPFLPGSNYNNREGKASSWPWPAYCQQPRTLSFGNNGDAIFKTINSAYLDAVTNNDNAAVEGPESWFTNSSAAESASFSDEWGGGVDSIEMVIRGLRSADRLFFEPGETSSILEEAKAGVLPFKESVVLSSMDSQDPFVDFKKSMEEMVEAHGLTDWEGLEDLLTCYLKVNGKSNHGYIIAAFVDLLVGLAFSSSVYQSCSCSRSPSSPLSFYTTSTCSDDSSSTPCCTSSEEIDNTPCLTSLEAQNDMKKEKKE